MKQEFEIISHKHVNFNLFLVNMFYRNPHIHREFEICFLLEGSLSLITQSREYNMKKGDFFVMNSLQSHELKSESPALMISAQVAALFFVPFFPQIKNLAFSSSIFCREMNAGVYDELYQVFILLARTYLKREDRYELKAAGLMNYTFSLLLDVLPFRILSDKEKSAILTKAERMRKIAEYIDANYDQKLLLSDIAENQQLTLSYLSHFFKDCFGVSFQDYLMKMRCERARQLLLLTDHSLLDISMNAGFSDMKYFNNGFKRQYGCSPKDYRDKFQHEEMAVQQKTMLTTQEVLSRNTSLLALERYLTETS